MNELDTFLKEQKLDKLPWEKNGTAVYLSYWNSAIGLAYCPERDEIILRAWHGTERTHDEVSARTQLEFIKRQVALYKASRPSRVRSKKVKPPTTESILKEISEYVDNISPSNVSYSKKLIKPLLERLSNGYRQLLDKC